jgi:hypothetical protein
VPAVRLSLMRTEPPAWTVTGAWVQRPDLLVLDEPTVGLDPVLRVEPPRRRTDFADRVPGDSVHAYDALDRRIAQLGLLEPPHAGT